jgi:acetyltransferase
MPEPLLAGHVALISQSGGFSTMIADRLMAQRRIGFSYLISCGNQAGLTVEDFMGCLVDDEDTQVIGAFVEGFKQPEKLRRVAARAATKCKPLVVMKVGRSDNARQATLAHTGVLAGEADIVEATLKQLGIVQVYSLNEMIETLALLSAARDYDGGWRVVVTTGSGGECGHAADAAAQVGLDLPPLSRSSLRKLETVMPDFATPRNPLDGTGAMYENPALFPCMMRTLLVDEGLDIVAINLNADPPRPSGHAPARSFSRAIKAELKNGTDRLVLCFSSVTGGPLDDDTLESLAEAGVPYLEGTETAMQAIDHLRRYRLHLQRRARIGAENIPSRDGRAARQPGRGRLTPLEARRLLADFAIPVVETLAAANADRAVAAAERLGYPVVLKIDSPDIAHKSDVGGVRLACADAAAVREAFERMLDEVRRHRPAARLDGVVVQPMVAEGVETMLGVKVDPLFGPAIVFGLGGIFVEVLADVSIRVPPISREDALAMISEVRGSALLRGARGRPPADLGALADAIVNLAALASDQRASLRALDLNPLLVLPEGSGVVAVDWLIEFA